MYSPIRQKHGKVVESEKKGASMFCISNIFHKRVSFKRAE